MAIPTKNIRSMQDVRTHSSKMAETFVPYKAYMRLSCLEMEKHRRGQEREMALLRVRNIEQRFEQIEAEKAAILAEINEKTDDAAVKSPDAGDGHTTHDSSNLSAVMRFKY